MEPGGYPLWLGAAANRPGMVAVLVLNLMPVVMAALFGWSAVELMLLYWFENLVIGAINVLKMAASAAANGPAGVGSAAFMIPFFCVHYGLFCLAHGYFVLALGGAEPRGDLLAPLYETERLMRAGQGFAWNLAAIVLVNLALFVFEWLLKGEAKKTNPHLQMFMPYGRIVVLHLALLGGLGLATFLGDPIGAVILLALGKTVLELAARAAGKSVARTGQQAA